MESQSRFSIAGAGLAEGQFTSNRAAGTNIARIRGAHRASAGESDGLPFMTRRLKQAKPPAHLVDYGPC